MQIERQRDESLPVRLKFILRAFIVSWILAYLAVYRSEPIARFLADSFFAGMHKMAVVWMLAFFILAPILGLHALYRRAMR